MSCLVVVSPAKSLNEEAVFPKTGLSEPRLLEEANTLAQHMKTFKAEDLAKLMKLSKDLSELNTQRFQDWSDTALLKNGKPALWYFSGDVYQGFEAETLTAAGRKHAQKSLRILSGLYGLLRPLDRILAYRLEMGTKLETPRGKTLYAWWGDRIVDLLLEDFPKKGNRLLVNCASNEYSKALKLKSCPVDVVEPVFHDYTKGTYKIVSFFAKRARGLMARYIVDEKLAADNGVEAIQDFARDGYRYYKKDSTPLRPVFRRKQ